LSRPMGEEVEGGLRELAAAGLIDASPEAHAPFELDGQPLGDRPVLRPADDEQLAQALAILSQHGMAALLRGGGSRLEIGNPARSIDVVLETRSLSGVSDFGCDDGVVKVRAGTPLSQLRDEVAAEGWALALDPPCAGATVGGTLAAAAVGPRLLGYGTPRDTVLGLDVVLASGERTRCGGRVVKNVTGYDVAKLYAGSFGTLGVMASAWLKLIPIPEVEQTLAASSTSFENMFAIAFEASRRVTARSAALLSPVAARCASVTSAASDDWVLVLELAGDELSCRADAGWLADRVRASEFQGIELVQQPELAQSGPGAVDRVRDLQGSVIETQSMRARFAALPTSLPAITEGIANECPGLVVYPGAGLVYAFSRGGTEAAIAAADACTRAAERAAASLVFEALPAAAKSGRDVFGELGDELALMRELKQRFDPTAVLNPGRFAGGI